jgi:hypothetical protein
MDEPNELSVPSEAVKNEKKEKGYYLYLTTQSISIIIFYFSWLNIDQP